MTPISRFTVQHDGRPGTLRSDLLVDGRTARLRIPGKRLIYQFTTERGFVLVTDFDCAFEETTSIILLDHAMRVITWRSIGVLFAFLPSADEGFCVRSIEWENAHQFVLHGYDDGGRFRFTIRPHHIPIFFPQLAMQRLSTRQPAA